MDYLRLDEICSLTMGQSPSSDSYNQERVGIPFFQGNADFGEIYPITRVWCDKPTKVVDRGTLLISVRAPIGALNFAAEKSCIGRGLAGLTAKNGYDLKYIYYALKYKEQELNNMGTGSTFKAISKSSLGEVLIPNISIEKQKNYVKKLDLIQKTIIDEKEQIKRLDTLIQSWFVEMFGDPITNSKGWSMVELGDLTNIGSSKRIFEKEYVDSGIPFYRTKEIVELSKGKAVTTEIYISKERFAEIKKQYGAPKIDDLLISAVGTIGTIWVVDGKSDFYFKDGNLIRVDASDKFNSIFMKQLLESLIDEYKKQISAGTAYAALTISGLTKMRVYDVPKEFQDKYAEFVHKADKLKSSVTKNLEKIETLKSALMQKIFS